MRSQPVVTWWLPDGALTCGTSWATMTSSRGDLFRWRGTQEISMLFEALAYAELGNTTQSFQVAVSKDVDFGCVIRGATATYFFGRPRPTSPGAARATDMPIRLVNPEPLRQLRDWLGHCLDRFDPRVSCLIAGDSISAYYRGEAIITCPRDSAAELAWQILELTGDTRPIELGFSDHCGQLTFSEDAAQQTIAVVVRSRLMKSTLTLNRPLLAILAQKLTEAAGHIPQRI